MGADQAKSAGREQVVTAEPIDDLAAATGETFVDGIALSGVFFADPPCEAIAVAVNDLQAVVGGTAINDENFEVGIILIKEGLERCFERGTGIQIGYDDGDGGARHCSRHSAFEVRKYASVYFIFRVLVGSSPNEFMREDEMLVNPHRMGDK